MSTIEAAIPFYSSDKLSAPPILIPQEALDAREKAHAIVKEQNQFRNLSSLELAVALRLYTDQPSESRDFHIRKLIQKELQASEFTNPLPTIGVEIEEPLHTRLFQRPTDHGNNSYGVFFDTIGMPRNRTNRDSYQGNASWEFSPPPSYSAYTQSDIIHSLIKMRALPSHISSTSPQDLQELFGKKLVSLHINIGVPHEPYKYRARSIPLDDVSRIFAIAYTSPERMVGRTNVNIFNRIRVAETTAKSTSMRIEHIAHEVRGAETYHLLADLQTLSGAFFAFYDNTDKTLSSIWLATMRDIKQVDKKAVRKRDTTDQIRGEIKADPNIQQRFQKVLHRHSAEVKRYIATMELSD